MREKTIDIITEDWDDKENKNIFFIIEDLQENIKNITKIELLEIIKIMAVTVHNGRQLDELGTYKNDDIGGLLCSYVIEGGDLMEKMELQYITDERADEIREEDRKHREMIL